MTKKDWSKRWKNVSKWWGKLNPPWTPSKGEFEIYESYFKQTTDFKNKNRSMLVLGATALLRELGHKYGYKITLIDINPEMIKDQTRFLGHRIPKEKAIIGDWLKMDKIFKNRQFDVIVGDHSVINVKFKDWPRLYENMQGFLKPGGYIFWATTVYEPGKYVALSQALKRFKMEKSDTDRFLRVYKFFGNPEYHDRNYGFHFGWLNKDFSRKAKNLLKPEEINNFQLEVTNDWVSVILPRKRFEKLTGKYFQIIDRKYDQSHLFGRYQQLYLLKSKQFVKKRSDTWKSIAEIWPDLKPPSRPSKGEIKIYEKYLKQIIKKKGNELKALLFGVTPEIRDLLAKYGIFVTMVDINTEMVKVTKSLCQQKNRKEKVVIDDWLKFNLHQKFDIILGDHVFGNVEFKKQPIFWRQIKKHLKNDGYLITNVHLRALFKKINLKQFIEKYRKNKLLKKDREEKWYWLYSLVYNHPDFYKKEVKSVLFPSAEELLRQAEKRKIYLDLNEVEEIADDAHMEKPYFFMIPTRQEFEKDLKKHFKIISSDINKKHPVYRCYRVYFAQPN